MRKISSAIFAYLTDWKNLLVHAIVGVVLLLVLFIAPLPVYVQAPYPDRGRRLQHRTDTGRTAPRRARSVIRKDVHLQRAGFRLAGGATTRCRAGYFDLLDMPEGRSRRP